MPDLSPEAKARASRTVEVASVFADNADLIAAAVLDVPAGHVLVAVVDGTHQFTGTHQVNRAELVERVPALEGPDGWAMVFSSRADAEHVRRRAAEMASLAEQRIAYIDRITARRNAG